MLKNVTYPAHEACWLGANPDNRVLNLMKLLSPHPIPLLVFSTPSPDSAKVVNLPGHKTGKGLCSNPQ
jgi:hypothetical protein